MYTRSILNDDHTPFEGFTSGGTTHIIEDDDITVMQFRMGQTALLFSIKD